MVRGTGPGAAGHRVGDERAGDHGPGLQGVQGGHERHGERKRGLNHIRIKHRRRPASGSHADVSTAVRIPEAKPGKCGFDSRHRHHARRGRADDLIKGKEKLLGLLRTCHTAGRFDSGPAHQQDTMRMNNATSRGETWIYPCLSGHRRYCGAV